MEMNEEERRNFAALMVWIRNRRFGGNRKAAYMEAGVNAATWTRVESGLPIKETSLVKILDSLVPEAQGDWTNLRSNEIRDGLKFHVSTLVGGDVNDDRDYVSGPGEKVEGGDSDEGVLGAIREMQRDMQAMEARLIEGQARIIDEQSRLSERVDRLEQRGS